MRRSIYVMFILLFLMTAGCGCGTGRRENTIGEDISESDSKSTFLDREELGETELEKEKSSSFQKKLNGLQEKEWGEMIEQAEETEEREEEKEQQGSTREGQKNVLCGTWYTRISGNEETELALTLILEPNGDAEYSYGLPYSDVFEKFEGSWRLEDTNLRLIFQGGPRSTEGQEMETESYEIDCRFKWDMQGGTLVMQHIEGDVLLSDSEGEWFTFLPFDSHILSGLWITNVEDTNIGGTWFYELQLYENTECTYYIRHSDSEHMAKYEGWWNMPSHNQISLSMAVREGEELITSQGEPLSGTYHIEFRDENDIILTHEEGTKLSLFMEDIGYEEFWRHK